MATTNETMKVIANGVDKKEEPEIIMGGKVIAVEVPDELAEIFEGIIGSLIEKSESAEAESPENNDSNGGDWDDDEELTEAEELAADIAYWLAHRASDNLMKVAKVINQFCFKENSAKFIACANKNDVCDEAQIKELASLPSMEVLRTKLLYMLNSTGSALVRALNEAVEKGRKNCPGDKE